MKVAPLPRFKDSPPRPLLHPGSSLGPFCQEPGFVARVNKHHGLAMPVERQPCLHVLRLLVFLLRVGDYANRLCQ